MTQTATTPDAQAQPATQNTVGIGDLVKGVLQMAPDALSMLRHAPGMLLRSHDDRKTIGSVFADLAAKHPDRPFVRFEGETLSYGEANRRVNRYAGVLADRGVVTGDVVGILAENSSTDLLVVLAALKLGAVAGMLNYNQHGTTIDHSMSLLDAKVLIRDPECVQAWESMSPERHPEHVLDFAQLDAAAADQRDTDPAVTATLPASTLAFYIFTSGTTGLPKASVMSHSRWLANYSGIGGLAVRLRPSDTMYVALPMYHNNALSVSLGSVLAGGACIAIGRKFSASRFWDEIIANRATAFCYIGELCRYLLAQPEKPTDRQHAVRIMVGNGLRPEIWDEFADRFGVDRVVEFYGSSELNLVFVNAFNAKRTAGFCPLPFKVVEYEADGSPKRYPDGRLRKVRKGRPGLLISQITERVPVDGYTDGSETEKKIIRDAFKDGDAYFNSGDLVRQQGYLHIAFVDRLGDTFRWKGENVATTEVEGALGGYPAITEAVVYGVEVPGCDGRAGMAAVTVDGAIDGKALAAHLYRELPAYAVPLFLREVGQIEATATFKNRKVELREESFAEVGDDPVWVLQGRTDGYVRFYEGYPAEVAAATVPR
ncbi:putative fatty-acid--CoA ligase [Gordonia hirsuta DSM 44140 = NBRC 16056]|uniref:Putative fatty-acid--CoA ligase n=1 Tax=Gordonia hirsuta DSM 44140 = NBRC 16056 TaxID=1121927 RepID=L7L844_9ACTN|nr:long-chain-acyl-CoA synthetase [Gordonia hirsuta]GAC56222.1 putative fatty-acid--CoA ligase [Gordonia hirsuta DSM 44140 = NBRC 16056]